MLRVGLTGGLASGKSFAAAEFSRLGCAVLEADKLGHQVLADDMRARAEVVAEFGTGILGPGGAIDRKALAAIVFADASRLERLNAIIHPRVFDRIEGFFEAVEKLATGLVAMVEAAVMIESGSYKRYQRIVLASCPRDAQIERFVQRDGGTRADAESRIDRQMPLSEKRRYAHFVIDTGGTEEQTVCQVREIYQKLRAEALRPSVTAVN
ncbi:MAG: dephospho-CoA kinase [Bryobacterales bacterium]|nr:dephospho-CoA kinase [Bryobacterales bacterium]